MKLVFRGHDDRYAVEQSLLAFFPEERPVYQEPEPGEAPDTGDDTQPDPAPGGEDTGGE